MRIFFFFICFCLLCSTVRAECSVASECRKCGDEEVISMVKCADTGYIEELRCEDPDDDEKTVLVTEPCVPEDINLSVNKVIRFELVMVGVAVYSMIYVRKRKRQAYQRLTSIVNS